MSEMVVSANPRRAVSAIKASTIASRAPPAGLPAPPLMASVGVASVE